MSNNTFTVMLACVWMVLGLLSLVTNQPVQATVAFAASTILSRIKAGE